MKFLLAGLLGFAAAMQAHADARADVQRAFEQIVDAGGFRGYAQGRVFGPALPAMAGEIEVVFPDRIHASTDEIEFIAIGAHAWISALGVWSAVDRALVPATAFDMAAMRRAIATIRDARVESASKTSQCQARVYRFRASGKLPGSNADGDMRAWICDGSGRLARVEATDARSGERVILDLDWSRRASVRAPQE
ncbi:MAG: hypothetical protein JSS16_00725 [Proteobacteria bacterium]|uniref:hypothetical protein n=1 Tax=Rudaea sp. TaxID=2136325 RepID=UPI001DECE1F2|nr:hypothetical protein [Pseudomonadota bacterium]MBS0566069.1 hypothetical protein [Pseudomonadota bacterium]